MLRRSAGASMPVYRIFLHTLISSLASGHFCKPSVDSRAKCVSTSCCAPLEKLWPCAGRPGRRRDSDPGSPHSPTVTRYSAPGRSSHLSTHSRPRPPLPPWSGHTRTRVRAVASSEIRSGPPLRTTPSAFAASDPPSGPAPPASASRRRSSPPPSSKAAKEAAACPATTCWAHSPRPAPIWMAGHSSRSFSRALSSGTDHALLLRMSTLSWPMSLRACRERAPEERNSASRYLPQKEVLARNSAAYGWALSLSRGAGCCCCCCPGAAMSAAVPMTDLAAAPPSHAALAKPPCAARKRKSQTRCHWSGLAPPEKISSLSMSL
mmetsp:Transcript_43804/g.129666  ORF Transcript_43804/g.129666 Transcript_43804/m.129666 type:complete len:321 (-) Transcript_43804:590-1552(-)